MAIKACVLSQKISAPYKVNLYFKFWYLWLKPLFMVLGLYKKVIIIYISISPFVTGDCYKLYFILFY